MICQRGALAEAFGVVVVTQPLIQPPLTTRREQQLVDITELTRYHAERSNGRQVLWTLKSHAVQNIDALSTSRGAMESEDFLCRTPNLA